MNIRKFSQTETHFRLFVPSDVSKASIGKLSIVSRHIPHDSMDKNQDDNTASATVQELFQ